ncbi:MAG TPA: hypothetical protein VLY03_09730 [Bacteroidota bacterium]|nr:hypothetical protein [Bacteroidota bacterium]
MDFPTPDLTARRQYAYFEALEKTIKVGLALYLLVFLAGILITFVGFRPIMNFWEESRTLAWSISFFLLAAFFLAAYWATSKIHGLGEVHIWMDQTLFGFLKKSNDIIFDGLLTALRPEEQRVAVRITPDDQGAIAQSIFSKLSSDGNVFDALVRSGIFRYWIWYWITVYGTFVFSVLTAFSFIAVVGRIEPYISTVFSTLWLLALLHLGLTLLLGFFLIRMTRQVVDSIVFSHRNEVASILRTNITRFQTAL